MPPPLPPIAPSVDIMSDVGAVSVPKSVNSTANGAASISVAFVTTSTGVTATSVVTVTSAVTSDVSTFSCSGSSSSNSLNSSSTSGAFDVMTRGVSFFGGSLTINAMASSATTWTSMLTAHAGACLTAWRPGESAPLFGSEGAAS